MSGSRTMRERVGQHKHATKRQETQRDSAFLAPLVFPRSRRPAACALAQHQGGANISLEDSCDLTLKVFATD